MRKEKTTMKMRMLSVIMAATISLAALSACGGAKKEAAQETATSTEIVKEEANTAGTVAEEKAPEETPQVTSEEQASSDEEAAVSSGDLPLIQMPASDASGHGFSMYIDGKLFELPCKLTDILELGYEIDEIDKDKLVSDYNLGCFLVEKDGDGKLLCFVHSPDSEKEVPIMEGIVYRLCPMQLTMGNHQFVFPGGITFGATPNELVEAIGEPNGSYVHEPIEQVKNSYQNHTVYNYCYITDNPTSSLFSFIDTYRFQFEHNRLVEASILLEYRDVLWKEASEKVSNTENATAEQVDVLFVGNSMFYRPGSASDLSDPNNLPQQFKAYAQDAGANVNVEWIVEAGRTLYDQCYDEAVFRALSSGEYEVVILAEQTDLAGSGGDSLSDETKFCGKKLSDLAKENGAKVFFYAIPAKWKRDGVDYNGKYQSTVDKNMEELAEHCGADGVIYAGKAVWEKAVDSPETYFDSDGYHPNAEGQKLAGEAAWRAVADTVLN